MLRPTYNDLIESLRREDGDMQDTESRYSVVIASAKRARQLIDGEDPLLPNEEGRKPLSIAIDEISHRVVGIERGSEEEDDVPVRRMETYARYSVDEEEDEEADAEAEEALSEDRDREDEEDEGDSPEDDYGSDDDDL